MRIANRTTYLVVVAKGKLSGLRCRPRLCVGFVGFTRFDSVFGPCRFCLGYRAAGFMQTLGSVDMHEHMRDPMADNGLPFPGGSGAVKRGSHLGYARLLHLRSTIDMPVSLQKRPRLLQTTYSIRISDRLIQPCGGPNSPQCMQTYPPGK